jgi:magnesium transporter
MATTSSRRRSPSERARSERPPSRPGDTAPADDAPADAAPADAAPAAPASEPERAQTADEISANRPGAVNVIAYGSDGNTSKSTDVRDIARLMQTADTRLWIDLAQPSHDEIRIVADALGLHPLIAEDIAELNQRSKVETFEGDVVHVVLFVLRYDGEATASEVDFVLGERFLLSVHDGAIGEKTTAPLRFGVDHALRKGPDYLLYALADTIVDGYFPVLDQIGDDIDEIQDQVMAKATNTTLERLFGLKRELAALRRATSPAREIFAQLTNREVPAIHPDHVVYYRDVYDHLIRVTDELDNDRDLVAGTLDIYVSIVNNDLSRIMKRLTGVTVILAGIGAVAGIFGMSEAGNAFSGSEAGGFWMVTAFVVLLSVVAAFVLHRIDWI